MIEVIILGALTLFLLAATFSITVIALDTLEEYKKNKKNKK